MMGVQLLLSMKLLRFYNPNRLILKLFISGKTLFVIVSAAKLAAN